MVSFFLYLAIAMVSFFLLEIAMLLLFLFMFRKQSYNGSLFKRFSKTGSDIFGKPTLQSRQGDSNGMETPGIVAVRSVLFIMFVMIERLTTSLKKNVQYTLQL